MTRWLALLLLLPTTALAADSEAGRLFEEAQQAMAAKDYATACSKFAASLRLEPGIGTRLWLADCYEQSGRLASAWRVFREAAAAAVEAKDTRADVAASRAAKLEPKLARIVLRITHPPPSLEVRLDGVKLADPSVAQFVDRGRHELAITGKPLRIVDVDEDGKSYPIDVAFAPPTSKPEAAEVRERTAWPIVGWSFVGVGALGVGVGGYFGLRARALYDGAADRCPSTCDSEGYDERRSAFRAANVSTALFIAGGAAAAIGVTVLVLAPSSRVRVGAASLHLEATF